MKNIYRHLVQYDQPSAGLVMATVTATHGSTPQKPGSTALFGNGRLLAGTVGGGFVENRVWEQAVKCLSGKESLWMHFSLDNDISRKEEAICGGSISILLDASPLKHLSVFREMETEPCQWKTRCAGNGNQPAESTGDFNRPKMGD